MTSLNWQISAGELFELLRPIAWTLSALLSACVLADAQHRQHPFYACIAWTLATLFFPFIVLPVYLIVRFAQRASETRLSEETTGAEAASVGPSEIGPAEIAPAATDPPENGPTEAAALQAGPPKSDTARRLRLWLLPPVYLSLVLSLLWLFLYRESQSVDAHLARANQARLLGQRERTIREYRTALRLEDDAHTHNLLAEELAGAGLWDEALAELRAAQNGGEPDEAIPYRIGTALDALKRRGEAAGAYSDFLKTGLCTQSLPDPRCLNARLRLQAQ